MPGEHTRPRVWRPAPSATASGSGRNSVSPPYVTTPPCRLKITPAAGIIINMVLELKVDLSDALAREAKDRGLLEPAAVERMLQAELKRSRVDQLFAAADRLAAQTSPSLSEAEVEEEIQAARAQRRTADASRR